MTETIRVKHLRHLTHLLFRDFNHFALFTFPLFDVMLRITFRGEIAAETHRDRACGNLSESGGHDYAGAVDCTSQPRRQSKRNRQSVRHADYNVADCFARGEVSFDVTCLRHFLDSSSATSPNFRFVRLRLGACMSEARASARASLASQSPP